jgi:DNA-binding transcriptional LysR family regulator
VQLGNLTAAAAQLNIALAAASRRINELEKNIGTELFVRHARGIEPTAAGRLFYSHGLTVLQSLERLSNELSDLSAGYSYHIRMLASSAALLQSLPQLLADYEKIQKSIHVDIEEDVSSKVATGAIRGEASIGVFIEGVDTTGLRVENFGTDELVLAIPSGHKLAKGKTALSFEDVLDNDWITLESGAALLQLQIGAAAKANRPLRVRTQVRSFDAVAQLVGAGLGLALLPKDYCQNIKLDRIRVRPLKNNWAKRNILIATRQLESDERVLALFGFLVERSQNAKSRPTHRQ